ncbi:MAG: division/cell wall cluster transcriptional repressor MraZ [Sphingobacteriales bacterium 41-5]|nr:MAG: division/cell wall cluster transcriptional repressor MraZ [Sphingobacteriales bacterium 41-5]
MKGLIGEFEVTLDSKGRFLLPSGFKKQLAEGDDVRFVINRGIENCLTIYPMSSWQPLADKIDALNDFNPKVREFKRLFLNGATFVEPDSAGRILIPARLKEHAGIEKDAVMMGNGEKMELWDKTRYKELFDSISAEDLKNLAAEVMAGM